MTSEIKQSCAEFAKNPVAGGVKWEIRNEDCLVGMKDIPDKSIDMVLCDLPYGTTQCDWDKIIPIDKLWAEYKRICKDNAAIVLTASQPFTSNLIVSNLSAFKYSMVWEKSKATGFLNAKKRPLVSHEDILVFCNGKVPYYPQMSKGTPYNKGTRKNQTENDVYGSFMPVEVKSEGARYPRSVIYFKTAESEGRVIHKSQKPIKLFEYLINTFTRPGDTVLDNCIGSGTTAIACLNTGRNCIGFEKELEFYNKALDRISRNLPLPGEG